MMVPNYACNLCSCKIEIVGRNIIGKALEIRNDKPCQPFELTHPAETDIHICPICWKRLKDFIDKENQDAPH